MSEGPLLPRGAGKRAAPSSPAAPPPPAHPAKRSRAAAAAAPEPPLFSSRKPLKKKKAAAAGGAAAGGAAQKAAAAPDVRSLLTFARISVGQKFLALVKSTNEHFVTLSLPNNLSAKLNWSEVSDEHFAAFEQGTALERNLPVHSFVRCIVIGKSDEGGVKAIRVSCRASLINKGRVISAGDVVFGSVKSLEDHGLLCNLGLSGISGFLKDTSTELQLGQPFEALVINMKNNVALLDYEPKAVAHAILSDRPGINIATLQPGSLVEVELDNELPDGGLLVRFLGLFQGTIDVFHRGPGDIARIIWVDPATKTVGLSTLPHLVARHGSYAAEIKAELPSEIVSDAEVTAMHKHVGLSLALPVRGFAHLSRLVDDPKADRPELRFSVKQRVAARVVGESALDGFLLVSLQPSVLSAAVLTYGELLPGTIVKGEVVKASVGFGLLVKLGLSVRGLVPLLHLSDAKVADVEHRFKVGEVVKARVLSCDVRAEKCQLTLKKSLVGSSLPVVASYLDCAVGQIAHGFVTKAADYGVVVGFYSGVHGLIPAHTLGSAAGDPEQYYSVGQTLKVRIVHLDAERERMLLSLDTVTPLGALKDNTSAEGNSDSLTPGRILTSVVVQSLDAQGLVLDLGENRKGFCPMEHLSDHADLCSALLKTYAVGSKVKSALILANRGPKPGMALVTFKPELLARAAAGELPFVFAQMQPEVVASGFVAQLTKSGVFVHFGNGLTALVPSSNLGAEEKVVPGQTVRASISSVESETKRVVASLKLSVVGSRGSAKHLESFLADQRRLQPPAAKQALSALRLGQNVTATVQARRDGEGLVLLLDGGLSGFCVLDNAPTPLPAVGTRLECRVLDWDGQVADVSISAELQGAQWRNAGSAEDDVEARVVLLKKNYAVVSLAGETPLLAFMATVAFNGPLASPSLAVGSRVRVRFVQGCGVAELLPEKPRGRGRARSGSLSEWMGPPCQVIVGATVTCRVVRIQDPWLLVEIRGDKITKGRIHSCDVLDPPPRPFRLREGCIGAFAVHSVGDLLSAKVVEIEKNNAILSLRPSELAGAVVKRVTWDDVKVGTVMSGWVDYLLPDGVAVGLSHSVRGVVFCTDVCEDESELEALFNKGEAASVLPVGKPVRVLVTQVDKDKRKCSLKMLW